MWQASQDVAWQVDDMAQKRGMQLGKELAGLSQWSVRQAQGRA